MSILKELNTAITALGLPVETGVFKGKAPDEYVVVTPLSEIFEGYADNQPQYEVQEARLSLYSKGNYQEIKRRLVRDLLAGDFTISDRLYLGYEADTGYHHFAIDVAKHYDIEENE